MNEQETFWESTIAEKYRLTNDNFSQDLGIQAWKKILGQVPQGEIKSYLECGCNIGRNIGFLSQILENASANAIEINPESLEICKNRWELNDSFQGSILDSQFSHKFDLVFTCGVLIHVSPDELRDTMSKMLSLSNKYVLFAEYFSTTPQMIEYHGQTNKLFKRDFGKFFLQNFDAKLLDYGFLWSQIYGDAGFDDVTYWLFEKN